MEHFPFELKILRMVLNNNKTLSLFKCDSFQKHSFLKFLETYQNCINVSHQFKVGDYLICELKNNIMRHMKL